MQNNMLKLNDDKTVFFVAVPAHLKRNVLTISFNIGDKSISPSDRVRNLGVIFDSQMSMSGHVNSLCSSLTYQLPNITRIHRFLNYDTCHLVTHALVLSRIHYGNGLLLGANMSDIQRLQGSKNWAAKLVCKSHKWDHDTPYLRELHWLTVDRRITFKVLMTVFKCLDMISPFYLSASVSSYLLLEPACFRHLIRPFWLCLILPSYCKSAERRTFSYVPPRMWNELPCKIRESNSVS